MNKHLRLTDTIGHTPLIRLSQNLNGASVWAKLEYFNPLGSVKDRPADNIVKTAIQNGKLHRGGVIVEATSGNMGIGLAMAAANAGCRLIVTMPEHMSVERIALMKHLGAEVILTPEADGMKGALNKVAEILANTTGAFSARQFENPANPQAHYMSTGPEIWSDTEGKIDIFVAGVGTGGTISGVGKFLKERNPHIKIIAVEPAESAVLSGCPAGKHGIQGIGAGFVPANFDRMVVDEILKVPTEKAIDAAQKIAFQSSILCGISSGANIYAAHMLANRLDNHGKTIVTIACDTGERYLSTPLFSGKQ